MPRHKLLWGTGVSFIIHASRWPLFSGNSSLGLSFPLRTCAMGNNEVTSDPEMCESDSLTREDTCAKIGSIGRQSRFPLLLATLYLYGGYTHNASRYLLTGLSPEKPVTAGDVDARAAAVPVAGRWLFDRVRELISVQLASG